MPTEQMDKTVAEGLGIERHELKDMYFGDYRKNYQCTCGYEGKIEDVVEHRMNSNMSSRRIGGEMMDTYTITLNIDRLQCVTNALLKIIDSGLYTSVKLEFGNGSLYVTPISDTEKIVLGAE